jgi:choline dehydrogenase
VLIVGAGSAGSVLAERLSADPGCRVTVVEAAELARELVGATAQVGPISSSQHLARTAPMGVDGDSVVDIRCRVHGVDKLWVVDGSVLPAITSRGPHATIVMIGHRAAEFIV